MLFFIIIALLNGVCIVTSRTLNGALAQSKNAFYASLTNHSVGFLFLSLVLACQDNLAIGNLNEIPMIAFIGGMIGTFFVVINSYVLPKLGVTLTTLFAIIGQVVSSFILDIINGQAGNHLLLQSIGLLLIILGVYYQYIKKYN
ncbi:DMT family transporter [Providencia stuartii]|nr:MULTISPECIES: DMT family transporter [Providencia]MDE8745089.1 DMT family transporter [Providencia thailandensis]MDE8764680.1 DMT family transporter [Providencia thailandensis]MDE8777183.1 DMT family transporter [Providencia thailandensis]MDE8781172.1 DMT family transporter [Providencia thailandensis]MDE8785166.1 DMT family transporter [Providencia thailandensis]